MNFQDLPTQLVDSLKRSEGKQRQLHSLMLNDQVSCFGRGHYGCCVFSTDGSIWFYKRIKTKDATNEWFESVLASLKNRKAA